MPPTCPLRLRSRDRPLLRPEPGRTRRSSPGPSRRVFPSRIRDYDAPAPGASSRAGSRGWQRSVQRADTQDLLQQVEGVKRLARNLLTCDGALSPAGQVLILDNLLFRAPPATRLDTDDPHEQRPPRGGRRLRSSRRHESSSFIGRRLRVDAAGHRSDPNRASRRLRGSGTCPESRRPRSGSEWREQPRGPRAPQRRLGEPENPEGRTYRFRCAKPSCDESLWG